MGEDRKVIIAGAGLGAAVAAMGLIASGWDGIGGGYSNADRESDRAKAKAKAERETWEPTPETRQQRRARERRELKRITPAGRLALTGKPEA